jgi:hypothetical protein
MPGLRNITVGFALLALTACQPTEPPKTPVASIDNATLTMEDVLARLDTSQNVSPAQIQEYTQRWITNEMLYREALRRGLGQRPDLANRLEDIRRQLLITALLEVVIYTDASTQSSAEEVAEYYRQHEQEFRLTSDVALVSVVLFQDREAANGFRNRVLRGTAWNEAIAEPEVRDAVIARVDSTYFTAQTMFPQELWRYAAAGRSEPSFPIRTEEGYYILSVWRYQRQGQPADPAYAEPEIRSRLTIERRRRLLDSLVENLRTKHTVQVFIGPDNTGSSIRRED